MGFVHLYGVHIKEFGEDIGEMAKMISPERKKQVQRLRQLPDRVRAAAAEILLWHGLSEMGLDITEYAVSYRQKKPLLIFRDMHEEETDGLAFSPTGLDFSFSHSGEYVICAISDCPIGADVQEMSKRGALLNGHIFTERELAFFSGSKKDESVCEKQPDQADELLFRRFWTCKESFIKCEWKKEPDIKSAELDLSLLPHPIVNRPDGEDFCFQVFESDDLFYTFAFCVKTKEDFSLDIRMEEYGCIS